MSTRSEIIKELADNYPGFIRSDLERVFSILLYEMSNALKRNERLELRNIFSAQVKTQKSGFKRNPKNGVTFFAKEKKKILFKTSKYWKKKINEKT